MFFPIAFINRLSFIIKEYLTLLSAKTKPFLSSILPRIGCEAISLILFSSDIFLKDSLFKSCKKINLNRINKNEIEEKISNTKGCLFNEISFLLGLVFIKYIKFI